MQHQLRVLHLEDSPFDAELARTHLEGDGLDCEVLIAQDRSSFESAIQQGPFDLILSDYSLPDFDGLRALSMVRAKYPHVPFILLSGTLGEEHAVESLKSGATDYVLKQRLTRLVPAVRRALHEAKLLAQRREAELELERVHQQLVETSRQAGMAEVATSVLHNVGNVLNSVNVSCGYLMDNLRRSKIGGLSKVVALLQEHAPDVDAFLSRDPKGAQVVDYLVQLDRHMVEEQAATFQELSLLQKNIQHIKDIVAMQQSYAKVSGLTESVRVTELIEDALRMDAELLARLGIHVVREYDADPTVLTDRHKVLQILINLIRNAGWACNDPAGTDKRLTIRVTKGDGALRIAVIDNGIGIPPQNLTRIFNHGFTTRKDGHGFALHSGALAAQELGGSLTAHSDGPGLGATFTLELGCP